MECYSKGKKRKYFKQLIYKKSREYFIKAKDTKRNVKKRIKNKK